MPSLVPEDTGEWSAGLKIGVNMIRFRVWF